MNEKTIEIQRIKAERGEYDKGLRINIRKVLEERDKLDIEFSKSNNLP